MRFRKLRIAWSVAWGVGCVLLIALWVRSYSWTDIVGISTRSLLVTGPGEISIATAQPTYDGRAKPGRFEAFPLKATDNRSPPKRTWDLYAVYGRNTYNQITSVVFSLAFLVLVSGLLALTPWLRWRFSLRTLLIATTLVAVMLGLIVAASRWPAS